MSDHERIWLQHPGAAHQPEGRLWCQDKVWPTYAGEGEPTEYVRVDLHEATRQKLEEAERERKNLQAQLTARAKSMLRLRDALTEVHDNIEDEGDRAYFGSTNDADQLREVWQDLEAWKWDDIMADGKLPDVYKSSREAHARAEAAEDRATALEAENATLRQKLEEAERANAANIQARNDFARDWDAAHKRADAAESRLAALEAENARLREALTKVSRSLDGLISSFRCSCSHPCDNFVWPGRCGCRPAETFRNIKVIFDAALTGDPAKPEGESHG